MDNNKYFTKKINNINTDYFIMGKGEVVVFVHGALADNRMWEPHCLILSTHFQTISYTQRYFGQESTNNEKSSFGIETHAGDLINFITSLNVKKVHLVAWSYGADVALNVAVKAPDLLQSVFLYEPCCPSYLNKEQLEQFTDDANQMFAPIFAAVAAGDIKQGAKLLVDGSGNNQGYFNRQSVQLQKQQMENSYTLTMQLSQAEPPILTKNDIAGITVPIAVAYGDNTRELFRIVSSVAQEYIPSCIKLVIKNANHMLPVEKAIEFSFLLSEFFKNHK